MTDRNLVVFDMDGVLVDVSRSYRDTVRRTARLFFKGAQNWASLPDPLFSLPELARVKQSGGLNNDWDLTAAVLSLLLSRVDWNASATGNGTAHPHRGAIAACDVTHLARYLQKTDRPLTALMAEKIPLQHPFASDMYQADVGSGNFIKQIFQEIYLGKALFESTYNMPAEYHGQDGLILKETLFVGTHELDRLARNNLLALATGRPEAEAHYPLERHGLKKYFDAVVSLDQCLAAEKEILETENRTVSLSKPHPYMLDLVASTLGDEQIDKHYYVGDMPDDMMAAARSASGYSGVGVVWSAPNPRNLEVKLVDAGAEHIVASIADLEKIVGGA